MRNHEVNVTDSPRDDRKQGRAKRRSGRWSLSFFADSFVALAVLLSQPRFFGHRRPSSPELFWSAAFLSPFGAMSPVAGGARGRGRASASPIFSLTFQPLERVSTE
jgi:hypothetical protein